MLGKRELPISKSDLNIYTDLSPLSAYLVPDRSKTLTRFQLEENAMYADIGGEQRVILDADRNNLLKEV